MSEQHQTDQNYEKPTEAKADLPAESARIEYEPPKLIHHGKVKDVTSIIPIFNPSLDQFSPVFDIS